MVSPDVPEKPARQKYDETTPFSWCDKCSKLAFTRRRKGLWICARCTKTATDREAAFLAAKAQLQKERANLGEREQAT